MIDRHTVHLENAIALTNARSIGGAVWKKKQ
jgi:hypothetical protein